MAFFDKVKEIGGKSAEMVKDASEIGKLKMKIASAEGDIKDIYKEVGKALVNDYPELFAEKFPEAFAKKTELVEKIEALKEQIAAVKAPEAEEEVEDEIYEAIEDLEKPED